MPQESLTDLLQQKGVKGLIFDLDGVVTQTAALHARAWKKMFDAYLEQRTRRDGTDYPPLSIDTDYRQHIDGIPRYDGVRNFLQARNIVLPEGQPTDPPGTETVVGLGNKKNAIFQEMVQEGGVEVYPDTIAFIEKARQKGMHTAIISASRNCKSILAAAGIEDLFEAHVDGVVLNELGLSGKPAPDVFEEAARRLNLSTGSCAIFEDAILGVKAGRKGNFALVVGLNRSNDASTAADLAQQGADVVLSQFPTLT